MLARASNPDAAPSADSVEAKRARLRELEIKLKYAFCQAPSDVAEWNAEIRQLKTELNISDMADVAKDADSCAVDASERKEPCPNRNASL